MERMITREHVKMALIALLAVLVFFILHSELLKWISR